MAENYLPGKVRLRYFAINGHDMRLHVKQSQIFETMCKPYFTGKFLIIDNNNVINGLKLTGGEPVSYAFDSGERIYEGVQYIVSIDGEESTESSRTQIYTISTCSISYFKDKGSLVQRADMNITATAAAAAIHNEYVGGDKPLHVDSASAGMVAESLGGGYQTMNKKPFKAIQDLLTRSSFGGFDSGSGIYFLAYDGYHMGPLEYYFASASPQVHVEQQATWGRDYQHIWTTTHAIIAARTVKNEDQSGRAGAGAGAAAAKGALNIFDVSQGMDVIRKPAAAGASGGIIGSSGGGSRFGGKGGGIQNVMQMDGRKNPLSSFQGLKALAQNSFQAKVKDGVNYLIKIPIQSGIHVTVGKGIHAKLLPPIGDQNQGRSSVGGLMLVADVMHECWFDDRLMPATTTLRAVSGLKH